MAFPDISTVRSYGGGAIPSVLTGSGISSTGTTFTVASVASWLENGTSNYLGTSGPFVVAIDYGESNEEKVLCSAINPTTNTVTVYSSSGSVGRAYDNSYVALGTSAGTGVTHAANAVVVPVLTSVEIQQTNTVGNKTLGKITAAGDLLVGDSPQSMKNLSIGASGSFLASTGIDVAWQTVPATSISGAGSTNNYVLTSTGTASAPVWRTVPAIAMSGVGSTTGYVLTSTGTGTAPTWQAAATTDSGWTTISSFNNSWVAGTVAPSYRLIGSVVYLRGAISSGTGLATAFTLPSGYRPSTTIALPTVNGSGTAIQIAISTGGAVTPNVTGTNVSLDSVRFLIN